MSQIPYSKEIEGLRGIAVLAVVLFHAGLGCPGGFVGVDVFLVISGYLITSIIARDMDRGGFTFGGFWERRLRRIFPAMAVCMIVTLGFGSFWLLPSDSENMAWSAIAQLGIVSNIYFWRTTDYFGSDIFTKPLLHTWSLSLEEQFYLFFPFVLWVVSRICDQKSCRSWRLGVTALLAVLSFGLSVWAVKYHKTAGFYMLPTRAWELLAGAVLALLPASARLKPSMREGLGTIGLGAVALATFGYDERTPFPGVAALLPCAGTMLVLWTVHRPEDVDNKVGVTLVGRLLSFPALCGIGKVSYSLYLWHWPVIVFFRYWQDRPFGTAGKLSMVGVALALSVLSWRFVESPIRLQLRWGGRHLLGRNCALMAVVVIVLCIALKKEWLVSEKRHAALADARRVDEEKAAFFSEALRKWPDRIKLTAIEKDQLTTFGCVKQSGSLDFIIIGDSHAYQLALLADREAAKAGITGTLVVHVATPPLLNWKYRLPDGAEDSLALAKAELDYVVRHRIKHVLLHACWSKYHALDPVAFEISLRGTISAYQQVGARIHILLDNPIYSDGIIRSVLWERLSGGLWKAPEVRLSRLNHYQRNAQMESLRRTLPEVTFLDPFDRLLAPGTDWYRVTENGYFLYFDGNHLNQRGVSLVWTDDFRTLFREIALKSQ